MRGKRATMEDFYTAQVRSWPQRRSLAGRLRLVQPPTQPRRSSKSHREAAAARWAYLACLTVRARAWRAPGPENTRRLTPALLAGHGGPNAADFVRQHLFQRLLANPQFSTDIKTALSAPPPALPGLCAHTRAAWADPGGCARAVESFVDTDRSYLTTADAGAGRDDGCTAVTAVLVGQKLIVANVGDSRAVLSRSGHGVCRLKGCPRGVSRWGACQRAATSQA